MSSETLITVECVSKKFCRNLRKSLWYGMQDLGSEILGRPHGGKAELRPDEFWALKDVSFELKRGECLGLIGRNGAGKTTILKMLNGLLKPDCGTITIRGRISALIALGAGFNPILTGKENIYVNAAILGLSAKETEAKFEEIVEFSELSEFIDTPVQSYSSGMQVRLGFSIATALQPDVLLLDEVLAVGDTRFRAKCLERIKVVQNNGGSILLVTHILEQVAHYCNHAILMDKGEIIVDADSSTALRTYTEEFYQDSTHSLKNKPSLIAKHAPLTKKSQLILQPDETRWGDRSAIITNISIFQDGHECISSLIQGVETEIKLDVLFNVDIDEPIFGLTIKSNSGAIVFNTNSRQLLGQTMKLKQRKGCTLQACFMFTPFLDTGQYTISVGIAGETIQGVQAHDRRYDVLTLKVELPLLSTGDIAMNPSFYISR